MSLVRYLAAGGSERESNETVIDQVRGLESVSDSAGEFVLSIGGFSNDLAALRLFSHSELARREALAAVQTRWNDDSAAAAGLLYRIGRALLQQGRAREAEDVLREGVARARTTGDLEVLSRNQTNLGEALNHQGL